MLAMVDGFVGFEREEERKLEGKIDFGGGGAMGDGEEIFFRKIGF